MEKHDGLFTAKRNHLYQFWELHVRRPMVLVGPSLGASAVIDFAVNHPEAVEKLVLTNASVFTEGIGNLAKLPESVAYAGVSVLKCLPLQLYANMITFHAISSSGKATLSALWWKEAMVSFMTSCGYNVVDQIKEVKHDLLIIYGEHDKIISKMLQVSLHWELQRAIIRQVPDFGRLLHDGKPRSVTKLITDFTADHIRT